MDGDHLLRVSEVAERTALSVSKVWQLILNGSIPSVSVGRSRRVRSSDLMTWMEALAPAEATSTGAAAPEPEPEADDVDAAHRG